MIAYPEIDPVALDLGFLEIRWYGMSYAAGILAALFLGRMRAVNAVVEKQQVLDLILYIALGAILGGRIGYTLFYNFGSFIDSPLVILKIWEGGMSFHGGLLGAVAGLWYCSRKISCPFLALADFTAPLCTLGLFFGRIANFINQELWGRPTDVAWAMVFPLDPDRLMRHPSQLYQALLEGIALFIILWSYSAKPRPAGCVCGLFLVCYGTFRIFAEFFREPDYMLGYIVANWVTMGQALSLPLVVFGLIIFVCAQRRQS